jgi:hypothetical protein
MVAAGPDVAVNIALGLPFIKAMGMVADFVDNVCEAKNSLCEPFPIDFRRATKSIPVFQSSPDRTACIVGVRPHQSFMFLVCSGLIMTRAATDSPRRGLRIVANV